MFIVYETEYNFQKPISMYFRRMLALSSEYKQRCLCLMLTEDKPTEISPPFLFCTCKSLSMHQTTNFPWAMSFLFTF